MNEEQVEVARWPYPEDYIPKVDDDPTLFGADLIAESQRYFSGQDRFQRLTKTLLSESQPVTWDHSVTTGFFFGALCARFHRLPFYVGQAVGQLHDIGKVRMPDLVLKQAGFTYKERELMKDHVFFSCMILADRNYPTIARVAVNHHLYGQIDKLPYPENYIEKNPRVRELGISLAVADKSSARLGNRPELTSINQFERMVWKAAKLAEVRKGFSDIPEASAQFDYLAGIAENGLVTSGGHIYIDVEPAFAEQRLDISLEM